MPIVVRKAIRSESGWSSNQAAMEAIYGVGGYYMDLTQWVAAMQAQYPNAVTSDVVLQADVYNDWTGKLLDRVNITGIVTDVTHYTDIRAAAGHETTGIPGSGAMIQSDESNFSTITCSVDYVHLTGLEIYSKGSYGTRFCISRGTRPLVVTKCLGGVRENTNYTNGFIESGYAVLSDLQLIENIVFTNMFIRSSDFYRIGNSGYIVNNVFKGDNFISTNSAGAPSTSTLEIRNNVILATTDWPATLSYGVASNNGTSKSLALSALPGANNVYDLVNADFVNAVGNDYHVSATSACLDTGFNMTSVFTTDIDGETWPASGAWHIGFDYIFTSGALTIEPSGIASAEAIGSQSLQVGSVVVTPSGIASSEAIGSPSVSFGPVTIQATGLPTAEAIGAATVQPGAATVAPAAISPAETFGTATVQPGAVTLTLTGIVSGEALGSATVQTGASTVLPAAIASAEAIGIAALQSGAVTLSPTAIGSSETFGSHTIGSGLVLIQATGIATSEAIGTATVQPGAVTLAPTGIASAEQAGTPQIVSGQTNINANGIASAEAIGTQVLQPGAVSILLTAIPSSEAIGSQTVTPAALTLSPSGIASLEIHGQPIITLGPATLTLTGIASGEQFGALSIVGGQQYIGWMAADIQLLPAMMADLNVTPAVQADVRVNRVH